uniref:Zinc-finger domain-containing protein n=1 Tax=Arundo donax TaxID=35708 RepID=A0A0A9BHA0_ARUDO
MGRLGAKSDYESLRDARISENMARMEMLGLHRCAGELSDIASAVSCRRTAGSSTPKKTPRPRVMNMTPLRRSSRLVAATPTGFASSHRRSARLNGQSVHHKALPPKGALTELAAAAAVLDGEDSEVEEKAVVVVDKERVKALQERLCDSKARGGVYDPVLGICCHFCRQKKLCGEEDCKRCGEGDLKQPCLGCLPSKCCKFNDSGSCILWHVWSWWLHSYVEAVEKAHSPECS